VILCDTGPLYAAADRKDEDHHACVELFTGLRLAGRRMLVPQTVVAEVGYMLMTKVGSYAEEAFLQALEGGDFEMIALDQTDLARVLALVTMYNDLPLGTTDASIVALAERLNITEIATVDHVHFRAVRPSHTEAFRLLPEDV
jgi:predicted nucleic acid-binding protein